MNADKFLGVALTMLPYMLKHQPVTRDQLCSVFNLDDDQLQDVLDTVMMCGLPGYGPYDLIDVWYEGDNLSIKFSDVNRPVRLGQEEILAILMGCRMWANTDSDWSPIVSSLEEKLIAAIDPDGAEGLHRLLESVSIDLNIDHYCATIKTIRTAIAKSKRIAMTYLDRYGDYSSREIEPWRLYYCRGYWYAECFCLTRREARTFRLDRMRSVKALDAKIETKPSLESKLGRDVFVIEKHEHEVQMECRKSLAKYLGDYFYAFEEEKISPDKARISFAVDSLEWLALELMPYVPDIKILKPTSLVTAIRDELQNMTGIYNKA